MSYHDEFDDPETDTLMRKIYANLSEDPEPKRKRPGLAAALVIASVIVLGIIIGVTYPRGGQKQMAETVPMIRADTRPFKVVPDDAGGMSVPYQGSTVFSSLRGEQSERVAVENLLAEEEQEDPMPKSQLFAGLNTDEDDQKAATAIDITETRTLSPAPVPQPQTATQSPQSLMPGKNVQAVEGAATEKVQPALPVSPQRQVASSVRPQIKPSKPPARASSKTQDAVRQALQVEPAAGAAQPSGIYPTGQYYVQMSSLKTHVAAELEWRNLQQKYPAQLRSKAYRIQKADLGAKGLYFRLQAGPFDKEYARDLCNQIKNLKPGGCLVVGR